MEDKTDLRPRLKAERRRLTAAEVQARSRAIVDRVLELVRWEEVRSLHLYKPLKSMREVDVWLLMEEVRRRYPEIEIATWIRKRPVWIRPNGKYESVAPGQKYDVIIVPVIGFNQDCHRIGFGGGFYDRFLAIQPQAQKIGLAYDFACCEFTPEPHDIPLDIIVTETRTFKKE